MDDVVGMLSRGFDFALMDVSTRTMMQQVYSSLPKPPVRTAAPLASSAAARAPDDGFDRISRLPVDILRNIVSRLPAKDAARTSALPSPGAASGTRAARPRRRPPPPSPGRGGRPPHGDLHRPTRRRPPGVPSPRRAPGPVPLRLPHRHPHGRAPGRDRALAPAPRREGRPGARLREPRNQVRDGSGAPSHALQVQLPHPPLSRMLEVPGDRRPPARRRIPLPPGTRPQFRCHGARGPYLPAGEMPRPGEAHARRKPVASVPPRPEPQSTLRGGVYGHGARNHCGARFTTGEALAVGSLGLWPSQQLDLEDQDWPCTKAAHPGILGAWNASTEIGNTIIKVGTKASPSTTVPSVKMLGVQVKLGVRNEARMLPSFLRCFPNVETLYVQSENPDFKLGHRGPQPSSSGNGKLNLKFWEEAGPIECVQRHIKKLVLREFRGQRCDLDFLKFIAERAPSPGGDGDCVDLWKLPFRSGGYHAEDIHGFCKMGESKL